jgi:F-type H+-transporting ATPase subunit a
MHVGDLDVSFTNSAFFMVLIVAAVTLLMVVPMRSRSLVPGRWQSVAELSYEFVANMLLDITGAEGRKYVPFIFSLFMFVLFANIIGMVPGAFTVTSHIVVTFAMAIVVFVGVTIIGLAKNGLKFFGLFAPHGVPWWLLVFLVPIELMSYFVRPVSLSLRLFANMMAGHTMLKVVAGFVIGLGFLGGWAPLAFMVAFTGFEIFVAILQAYIFTVLSCLYLNDALHPVH